MMKHIFSIALFLGFIGLCNGLSAQNSDAPDSRLMDRFSKKELKALTQDELNYWTFYLDNSYLIVDIPKEKPDAVSATIKLASLEKKDINVFSLGLKPHAFARDYLKIEGTNKMFVILPQTEIDQKYKGVKP